MTTSPKTQHKVLSGWGGFPKISCDVSRAHSTQSALNALAAGQITARGLGRSYADQAVSSQGLVVDCTPMDRYLAFDEGTGLLTCEGGTSLASILRDFVPRGFLPAVTPGTKFVTVAGCIANDVHGKAHHVDGCFSQCTESFRLLMASGEILNASREENSELFWANFGGMGQLGFILDATIKLRPVTTAYFKQTAVQAASLEELLGAIDAHNHLPYSVAWVDSLATGKHLGRGVLTVGEAADVSDLRAGQPPLKVTGPSPLGLPFNLPERALNRGTIRILNFLLGQVQHRAGAIAHYEKFFYPLDFIADWHRGYGARGFCQYQFVVPKEGAAENLRSLLETIATSDKKPFLNVLKRFGAEQDETSLSFPFEGYTFAIDFPISDGLEALLTHLDEEVLRMGGRVYLGKDAFLSRQHFEAMYPRLARWKKLKREVDPANKFTSHLAQRLGLSS